MNETSLATPLAGSIPVGGPGEVRAVWPRTLKQAAINIATSEIEIRVCLRPFDTNHDQNSTSVAKES